MPTTPYLLINNTKNISSLNGGETYTILHVFLMDWHYAQGKFTKLLKPVYSTLRQMGHLSVSYIDDSYLQADSYEMCVRNIIDTATLLNDLGFVIHPEKSILIPTQRLVFLGFILDSTCLQISLTPDKALKIKSACQQLLDTIQPSIRQVAKVLGLLTSSFPGVMYGQLHYRYIELDKIQALRHNRGNFEGSMLLSSDAIRDLEWWIQSIETAYNTANHGVPQLTMTTDAPKKGWGCMLDGTPTGGCWTSEEAESHINVLETKAVLFALKSFKNTISGKVIKVLVDNTTAVSCINNMGTCHSMDINRLVITIWEWCISHRVWLLVSHIPGKDNVTADAESRKTRRETEWSLNPQIACLGFRQLHVTPNVDLFASRINYKCEKYVSYLPDPGAYAVNAFHISWEGMCFYAFPPFCIIQKVLKKIREDKATGLIVVPYWPTQPWWPYLTNMLIASPIILPRDKDTLWLPSTTATSSVTQEFNPGAMPLVRTRLTQQGISEEASTIILQGWRSGTQKQYQSYLTRWQQYCGEQQIDPVSSTVTDGLNFLAELYGKELSYNALNTARSALSTVIFPPEGGTFGDHPLVTKFLKGVFDMRPSLPRYQEIWDVSIVLRYLKFLSPLNKLSLKELSLKLTMLIALMSGQRCQTIHALNISQMTLLDDLCIFFIKELLKTSKPGKHFGRLELKAFDHDS